MADRRPLIADNTDWPGTMDTALKARGLYLPAYSGLLATGCYHPDNKSASLQFNSRSGHIARENITSLQVAFPNNYSATEVGPGASMTLRASIEYPAGTYTVINWSSARDVTIADGADSALSDAVTIAIPRGALFWVRSFAQCASGVVYKGFEFNQQISGSESAASGLTDKTTAGTIASSGSIVAPCLIVGQTDRPTLAILGDSINAGRGDTAGDVSGDVGIVARTLGPHFAYLNQGVSGEELGNFIAANGAKRRARAAYCSHVICEYGRNDFSVVSGAVVAGYVTTCAAFFAGKPFFQTTVTPRSTSTDSWATTVNQTVDSNNGRRLAFNRQLRAGNIPGVYDFFDVADVLENTLDGGLWKVPGYTADGTHPTNAAYLAVRQARVLDPLRIRLAR